jgi:type I restriction enzyme S subunit
MTSKTNTTITKPALVPKLRFPEFRGSRGWENKVIGPYLEDCSGRVPPDTELPVYSSTREGLKRQDAYFDGRVLQNKNEYGVVPPGCLVYRHMSDDGLFKFNINQTGGDIAVSKEYPVFSTKGLNPVFLLAKLNDGLDFKNFALSQKAGGTRTRLYFSRLCEWRTLLPSLAEQQKIAECLSSMDELMAAQARKVDALKTHKKGLMQQLFPREGETVPRLRFPEFQNAGEWEWIELGEKVDLLSGYPFDGPDISQDSSGIPLLRGINVTEGRIRHNPEIDRYYTGSTEGLEKFRLQTNDLVIGMDGSKVGKNSALVSEADAGALLIQRVARLRAKKASLIQFVFQRIHSPLFHAYVDRINTSSGIPHISAKQIKDFRICFPSDEEQERIATCLSSLDALITAETQKHEALKTHKRGLMQQLFPSPGEPL